MCYTIVSWSVVLALDPSVFSVSEPVVLEILEDLAADESSEPEAEPNSSARQHGRRRKPDELPLYTEGGEDLDNLDDVRILSHFTWLL